MEGQNVSVSALRVLIGETVEVYGGKFDGRRGIVTGLRVEKDKIEIIAVGEYGEEFLSDIETTVVIGKDTDELRYAFPEPQPPTPPQQEVTLEQALIEFFKQMEELAEEETGKVCYCDYCGDYEELGDLACKDCNVMKQCKAINLDCNNCNYYVPIECVEDDEEDDN